MESDKVMVGNNISDHALNTNDLLFVKISRFVETHFIVLFFTDKDRITWFLFQIIFHKYYLAFLH